MTKHDTWVRLKEGHPFEAIEHLFPDGFPMRDPFPLDVDLTKKVALWFMDMERLDSIQISQIAELMAAKYGVESDLIINDALSKDGFALNSEWVESMTGDVENYRRNIEAADYHELHPELDDDSWENFRQQQYRDWIYGDRVPEPLPENYEDIDPRFKSPELEKAYKQRKINQILSQGDYSVLDVLMGEVTTDILNAIDPESEWSLATDEDL